MTWEIRYTAMIIKLFKVLYVWCHCEINNMKQAGTELCPAQVKLALKLKLLSYDYLQTSVHFLVNYYFLGWVGGETQDKA